MKYLGLFSMLLVALLAGSLAVNGQDGPPPDDGPRDERPERRPNLFAELGLSREQVQQIRRINQQRRPLMMEAQRRMRMANHALNAAIYRDLVIDEEFQARLKELQAAQADLARLRFESELSIRKILTTEQLVRFRDLRQKFGEAGDSHMRNRRIRRNGRGLPPMRDRPINE